VAAATLTAGDVNTLLSDDSQRLSDFGSSARAFNVATGGETLWWRAVGLLVGPLGRQNCITRQATEQGGPKAPPKT